MEAPQPIQLGDLGCGESSVADATTPKAPPAAPAGITAPTPSSRPDAAPDPADLGDADTLRARWQEIQKALQGLIQREQFETWFRRAELRRADGSGVCLAVQNDFTRDWLERHYRGALERAVGTVFGPGLALEFVVDAELVGERRGRGAARESSSGNEPLAAEPPASAPAPALGSAPGSAHAAGAQASPATPINRLMWASDVPLNPHYRFDNFVVGPCNRFAHAAAVGVSENPGKNYNPFFLHGSNGLGKTHLLQSLCCALLERTPQTRILYLSCETFVNHFIAALTDGDLTTFRSKYRNVDVLVVDDIHLLANKERTQEEFFHTFNTLYNAGKQIVLSSDTSPKEIPTLQERLVSRFKWGLVTEIERPCYETRMAILKRKSRERGHELPEDVARLLAEHIDRNIRELEGAVTRLQGYASLSGQALTPELATRVLRDVFTNSRGQLSMEEILRVVTAHFNTKLSELQSKRRSNAIVFPRQIGMYLIRKCTRHSLEEIGGFFGGRDHSTVLYAIERVEQEMGGDPRTRELVSGFMNQLRR